MAEQAHFNKLAQAFDKGSWNMLSESDPELAAGIEDAVKNGETPEDVRRWAMAYTQRLPIALRCQQAAAYLWRLKAKA